MRKLGKQTIMLDTPPYILETSSIVGPKEAQGPLAKYFDQCLEDEFWGEKTWEKAESKIIKENVNSSPIEPSKEKDPFESLWALAPVDLFSMVTPCKN